MFAVSSKLLKDAKKVGYVTPLTSRIQPGTHVPTRSQTAPLPPVAVLWGVAPSPLVKLSRLVRSGSSRDVSPPPFCSLTSPRLDISRAMAAGQVHSLYWTTKAAIGGVHKAPSVEGIYQLYGGMEDGEAKGDEDLFLLEATR